MSKIKLLLAVVTDLKCLADSLMALAETMTVSEAENIAQTEIPIPTPTPEPKPTEKKVTLEQVRAVLADKSHEGFTAEVRALLEKYGAEKLSKINLENYAALLADAEELK